MSQTANPRRVGENEAPIEFLATEPGECPAGFVADCDALIVETLAALGPARDREAWRHGALAPEAHLRV